MFTHDRFRVHCTLLQTSMTSQRSQGISMVFHVSQIKLSRKKMHYDVTPTVQKAWGQMNEYMDKKAYAHGLAHTGHVPLPTLQASHVRALSGLEAMKTIGIMSWGSSPQCRQ